MTKLTTAKRTADTTSPIPPTLIVFPNCKINLGLNITGKRKDGYHNLETVFVPVMITDVLETITRHDSSTSPEFSISGAVPPGESSNNSCLHAYQLLKNDFPDKVAPLSIYLHKVIPAGAGLGGGSADAAFMLTLLDAQFNLQLTTDQLLGYAIQLGSDCPFFIINRPCFASGRGELMEPVDLALADYRVLLVHPGIHISTAAAFSNLLTRKPVKPIRDIIRQPISTWKEELQNDFEATVFKKYPVVQDICDQLYHHGAVYAAMSGSGSAVYGLFPKEQEVNVQFEDGYFVRWASCKLG